MSDKRRELADAVIELRSIVRDGYTRKVYTDLWEGDTSVEDCSKFVPLPISENLPKLEAWLGEYLLLSIVGYGAGRGWEVTWKGIEIYVKARANDEQTARTQAALAAHRKLVPQDAGLEGEGR